MFVGTGLVGVALVVPIGILIGVRVDDLRRKRDAGNVGFGTAQRGLVVGLGVQLARHIGVPLAGHFRRQGVLIVALEV